MKNKYIFVFKNTTNNVNMIKFSLAEGEQFDFAKIVDTVFPNHQDYIWFVDFDDENSVNFFVNEYDFAKRAIENNETYFNSIEQTQKFIDLVDNAKILEENV